MKKFFLLYMLQKKFIISKSSKSIRFCTISNVFFAAYESMKMFRTSRIQGKMFSAKHIAAVLMIIGMYVNPFYDASVPVAVEKKIIVKKNDEDMTAIIPEIRVMTYNIHRGINRNSKLELDEIAKVIENSGAGIIALQEVERFSVRTGFKDQIKYLADRLSMQYAYGKSINILNGQYGNAILSKYPIEEYEAIELPSGAEKRTLLRASLNVYENRISFFSTHLGLRQDERDMQVREIMRITGDDKDIILAGDFNTSMDKLRTVAENYEDSASFGENGDKSTFGMEGSGERIDYIFVSKDFDVTEYDVLESDASDHYPVICTLKLKN